MNAIIGVSTFLSFYGHLLFYKATKSALHGYGLRAKFICIIVVLVLCGLQSGILETMGALEVFPCIPPFSVLARSQCESQPLWPLPDLDRVYHQGSLQGHSWALLTGVNKVWHCFLQEHFKACASLHNRSALLITSINISLSCSSQLCHNMYLR